jgi:hypothetical protein
MKRSPPKAVAAAAAVCAAALAACTAGQHSPASGPAPSPGGMPGYYVVVAGSEVVIHASGNGHVTGSAALPVPAGTPHSPVSSEAFGTADDRDVVIVVSRGGDLPGVADVTLFRLTVSLDGRPTGLDQLNFDSTGVPVTGAALSPDGKMLALSLVHEFPPGTLYGSVEVLNVASGGARTWTGQGAPGYWPGVPSWAGDGTVVVVPWWHSASQTTIPAEITGVRELDLAAPGDSLAAARLVAFPAPALGLASAVIAPGGDIVASSCRAAQHTATAQVAELSGTDGRLIRVLRTQTARFPDGAAAQDAILATCQVLSVAGDGDHVLVRALGFGRIDNGVFTSLPGMSPGAVPVSATW